MYNKLVDRFRSRVLLAPQPTGGGAAEAYLLPTGGVMGIVLRAVVSMNNAADVVLSLKYADDAGGTGAEAYPVNVAIYEDGVRQTDAKAYTVSPATGDFIVDFCIDPATIPEDKYVGLYYANSHNDNLLSAEMVEDVGYKPTPA